MSTETPGADEGLVYFHQRELWVFGGKMLASMMHLNSAMLHLTRDEKDAALEQIRESGARIDEILNTVRARIDEAD